MKPMVWAQLLFAGIAVATIALYRVTHSAWLVIPIALSVLVQWGWIARVAFAKLRTRHAR